jgi:two-component system chemotaxis response regulator CheB
VNDSNCKTIPAGNRLRVLVVDDSVAIRRMVCAAIEQDDALEVAGTASNGLLALAKIPQCAPDVVTLDIEMPELDGLETLKRIRSQFRDLRVIMFSQATERGATVTLDALALGADDYIAKPQDVGSFDGALAYLRAEMVPRLKQFFHFARPAGPAAAVTAGPARRPPIRKPAIVVIGVSTGGPNALSAVIPKLPARFPLPVLLVQHMPPVFTRQLAERLHSLSALRVEEATQGALIEPGKVLIAPGDFHLRLQREGQLTRAALDQAPPENSCRPSVDVLFRSASEVYQGAVLAVVMTGMGQDGLRGAQALYSAGAQILIQDEKSSVVWGMPGAIAEAGLADAIAPLDHLGVEIERRIQRGV